MMSNDGKEFPAVNAEAIPMGERVAVLETDGRNAREDMTKLSRQMDEVLDRLRRIESAQSERRGADRLGGWIMDGIKMIGAGGVVAAIQHFAATGQLHP